MHKEDIKAELRKRFGTVRAFEEAYGLPRTSVKDVLRGRSSAATELAISNALQIPLKKVFPTRYAPLKRAESSTKGDGSTLGGTRNRLTRAAS